MQRVNKIILMAMTLPFMSFNLSAGEDLGREVIKAVDYTEQYGESASF
ncbi:MAG: hypothetical protein VX212_15675 [Pseudomonadota bacterium]|nr:hypothetical protein [Pseudomonadota bacterium]